MKKIKYFLSIVVFIIIIMPAFLRGQQATGLPFLKIGMGARQAGMGDVFTGVGDDLYSIYWNPGGLGHIRKWQWAASFNRWFADIYQADFAFCKQFRAFGSRKTALALYCSYMGMPSWDATGGSKPSVSVDHLAAGISIGYRIDWISRMISIGATVKYISSRFDTYAASGTAGDFGILIKPDRFKFGDWMSGLFDYGIISLGASVSHVGSSITFDEQATALPRTYRIGASLLCGKYKSFSMLLASDMILVRDRDWTTGIGTEIWWHDIVGIRAGYKMNGEDLGDLSFGIGLRCDDIISSFLSLPSRYGDGVEINFADELFGSVLKQSYRGTVNHYPVAPEPFRIMSAYISSSLVLDESSGVLLSWEKSPDPDPFDEVNYYVMVSKDSLQVERSVKIISEDMNKFLYSPLVDSLFYSKAVSTTCCSLKVEEGGIYYWAVASYDRSRHVQLAQKGDQRISYVDRFVVATHDLAVKDFKFIPEKWITTTPEQGLISIKVTNKGLRNSSGFTFKVIDLFEGNETADSVRTIIYSEVCNGLSADEDTTFKFQWDTPYPGNHIISGIIMPFNSVMEVNTENNRIEKSLVSIPKGRFLLPDTVEVMATGYDSTDIPIVPAVYFDPFSDVVKESYYDDTEIPSPALIVMARRIRANSDMVIRIRGSIDALSGEKEIKLADTRAESVKNILLSLGVRDSQIKIVYIHPDRIRGKRRMPADPNDAVMIMQQYRVVIFEVNKKDEEILFGPLTVAVDTTMRNKIIFNIDIVSPGNVKNWHTVESSDIVKLKDDNLSKNKFLKGQLEWNGNNKEGELVARNRKYEFNLVLIDDMDRVFYTHPVSMYLSEKRTIRKREVFGAAKFAKAEPVYQFYWNRLMLIARELSENLDMRVKFEGHACIVGSDEINERLSYRRAKRFSDAFKERVKNNYPGSYIDIWKRIDSPEGFGEKIPLKLKLRERKEKLLGDNDSPVGRYLNRRIMVLLYKEN